MLGRKPFNALIISSDTGRRGRLKLAVHHDQFFGRPAFKKVHTAISLQEGIKALCSNQTYEIVLVTDCFSPDAIEEFLKHLSEMTEQKVGVVLVRKGSNEDGLSIAESLMNGVDGFLYEPFSVDMLREISKIAEKVRKENSDKKISAATDLVVDSMSAMIDKKAAEMSAGKPRRPYPKRLLIAAKLFRGLSETGILSFYHTLFSVTEKSKPFEKELDDSGDYQGASEIIRKKYNKKKEEELEEEKEEKEEKRKPKENIQVIYR